MKDGYQRGVLPPQATRRQMDVLAAYVAALRARFAESEGRLSRLRDAAGRAPQKPVRPPSFFPGGAAPHVIERLDHIVGGRAVHFHRGVALAAQFGTTKPWSEMASKSYALEDVASALDAVASRAAVKAVVRP